MKYSLNNTTMQRDAKSTSFFYSKAFATYLKPYWKPCLYLPDIYFTNFEAQFTVQF